MSSWLNRPPASSKIPSLRVIRTPGHGSLRFTSFAKDVVGAMTHYSDGRTQLCLGPDCKHCEDHQVPRWYGYIPTYTPRTMARRLFEFPEGPSTAIDDYLRRFPNLLGARITCYRKPARSNGPVYLDLDEPDPGILKHPDEVDTFRLLCQMWKVSHLAQLAAFRESSMNQHAGNVPIRMERRQQNNIAPADGQQINPFRRGLAKDLEEQSG